MTAATSKMELFVIIANGWKPLTIYHKDKELHLECCSSRRSASDIITITLRHSIDLYSI